MANGAIGNDDDTVFGGQGNDILQGGVGADEFQFNEDSNVDIIMDFIVTVDLISLIRNINSTDTDAEALAAAGDFLGAATVELGDGRSRGSC